MSNHKISIVLVNPQIHWNSGAIGRTCVALNASLKIIHPCGFSFDEREVKRAGLDYWQYLDIEHFDDWQSFLDSEKPSNDELFFFSTKAKKIIYEAKIEQGAYLIFGSETKGLQQFYHDEYAENMYKLPMYNDKVRSLNLSNTATVAIYEAIRQISY